MSQRIPNFRLNLVACASSAVACFIFAALTPFSRAAQTRSGFITISDGVKIHYLEAGVSQPKPTVTISKRPMGEADVRLPTPSSSPSILFIPGWTMPAWIWQKQIDYFSQNYRVVAMDPRSQGESTVTAKGLYPAARARDIKAVIDQLHLAPVVLVGWSMAVTELAAYVDQFGTRGIAGFVFVDDNFGGMSANQAQDAMNFINQILTDRQKTSSDFIRTVFFEEPQPDGFVDRVIAASLKVPTADAVALLVGKFAADYRAAAAKIDKPSLFCYAKSPYMSLAAQQQIQDSVKGAHLEIFDGSGHALFVDDADHFNSILASFLQSLGP